MSSTSFSYVLLVANALQSTDFERMREHLKGLPTPTDWPRLTAESTGALGVFLLVFLSTFPVVVRSIFMQDPSWRCTSQMSSPSRCDRSGLRARRLRRHAPHSHRPHDGRRRGRAGGAHNCPRWLINIFQTQAGNREHSKSKLTCSGSSPASLGSATPQGVSRGLQTRTKVLNGDLEDTFRRWYRGFPQQKQN